MSAPLQQLLSCGCLRAGSAAVQSSGCVDRDSHAELEDGGVVSFDGCVLLKTKGGASAPLFSYQFVRAFVWFVRRTRFVALEIKNP